MNTTSLDTRALQVCAECDAAYPARPVASDAVLRCGRCGATLARGHAIGIDGQLALTIAALVVFLIASGSRIVTLEWSGLRSVATLAEATLLTWQSGARAIALLSLFTAFVFPLAVVLLRLWVLVPLRLGRLPRALGPVMRAQRALLRWSMLEVFMLGVLIAVVRSAGDTTVVVGPGLVAYGVLTVLLTAMQASGVEALWREAAACPA